MRNLYKHVRRARTHTSTHSMSANWALNIENIRTWIPILPSPPLYFSPSFLPTHLQRRVLRALLETGEASSRHFITVSSCSLYSLPRETNGVSARIESRRTYKSITLTYTQQRTNSSSHFDLSWSHPLWIAFEIWNLIHFAALQPSKPWRLFVEHSFSLWTRKFNGPRPSSSKIVSSLQN